MKGAFFNSENQRIGNEYLLKEFESGISAPDGASTFKVYARENNYWRGYYHDNDGWCSFEVE